MDAGSVKILLVEDNPGDARLVEWYLSKPGTGTLQVIRAERLNDALRELAATRFDLVLLDLSLPDSTGLDTVLGARRAAGMTPIVILTGLDDEETALAALRNGAQDYLVKGKFDSRELIRSLSYAIERERIEQALRQTKEALEAIIAASPAAVLSLDTEGRVLTWNESAEHIFGWTAAEAVGRIPPFVPEGSEAEFGSLLKQVLAGEPVPDLESRRPRKDGTLVDVSLSARPIRGADGAASGVVAVLADITRRKQAEAELAAEAERTAILFEHAPDAYYLSDFHGKFLDGNRAAEQILGYRREELVGENLLKLDLLPMSEVTKVAGLLVRNAFGQATGPDVLVIRRRDGSLVAAELYTHIVTIHGHKVVLNSMRDITERKRIERTLRERVRELDCLYGVARLVEKPGTSRDELLQGVVSTLAHAMQRAEVAGARLRVGESEYRTPDWEETTLRIQESLRVDGVETGALELGYLPDIGESGLSFLPEEHNLLFAVATQLGRILERLQAAAALSESEERYRDLFENATDLIQSVGPDGQYIFTNRHWRETLGYTGEEVARLTMFDVLAPESHDHCRQLFAELMHGGDVVCAEATFLAKDGRRVFVEGNLSCSFKDGKPVATRGFFRDITERKLAEAEIAQLNRRNKLILDAAGEGIVGLDSAGRCTFINPAALQLLGYGVNEMVGQQLHVLTHHTKANGEPYPPEDCPIYRAFKDGLTHRAADELFWRKDATSFAVEYTSTPVRDDGQLAGAVVTFRDITERKLAEAEIARKNVELAGLNTLKNQFLGMAAHDLRNPLTVVNTASSFLLDDSSRLLSAEQKREFIRRINANGEFMLKLINDLLDVAKIESGRLDLELATGDLCNLIEENLTMNRMLAEKKGIRLDFVPECGLPPLRFDRGKVEQVLNNLISNALNYSAPGTTVTIRASRMDGSVVVSVQDQGPGIPAEELDHLFKPFSRTSVRSTAGEKSTGLGLAISRKIVDGHGGRIWAESEVGRGSTFSFSLPAPYARPAAPEKARRRTSNQTRSAVP
jgi:PAS domain S-box-containing protein